MNFAGVIRYGIVNETCELIEILKTPYFTTPMGKGGITEKHTRFGGLYAGVVSDATARDYVETADCVLRIGNIPVSFSSWVGGDKR
jgi:pyruvate decarboxylase